MAGDTKTLYTTLKGKPVEIGPRRIEMARKLVFERKSQIEVAFEHGVSPDAIRKAFENDAFNLVYEDMLARRRKGLQVLALDVYEDGLRQREDLKVAAMLAKDERNRVEGVPAQTVKHESEAQQLVTINIVQPSDPANLVTVEATAKTVTRQGGAIVRRGLTEQLEHDPTAHAQSQQPQRNSEDDHDDGQNTPE